MKYSWIALAILCYSTCAGQGVDYLGAAIASNGAGTIGQRSGQDLELRMFGGVNGIYDNGLVPVKTDANGTISQVGGLKGIEASIGSYGQHAWRKIRLGLDYSGSYRKYDQSSFYNGTNQGLGFGLTYQKSRRLVINLQESLGTYNQGGSAVSAGSGIANSIVDQNSLLFDNRTSYAQTGMDLNYSSSARTQYSIGGTGYTVRRKSAALVGVNGYTLRGNVKHALSRATMVVGSFQHTHYDYPKAFGDSDLNTFIGQISHSFGRNWSLSLGGGAYLVETQGIQNVAVDPAIAALLGTSTTIRAFYRKTWLPSATASLSRVFRHAVWSTSYDRSISSGNGVYLTSQQETYGSSLNYTGIRKWSFSVGAGKSTLSSVAQGLQAYGTTNANAGVTYSLPKGLSLVSNYSLRKQNITQGGFRRNSNRLMIGITYSPGSVPISFH